MPIFMQLLILLGCMVMGKELGQTIPRRQNILKNVSIDADNKALKKLGFTWNKKNEIQAPDSTPKTNVLGHSQ